MGTIFGKHSKFVTTVLGEGIIKLHIEDFYLFDKVECDVKIPF